MFGTKKFNMTKYVISIEPEAEHTTVWTRFVVLADLHNHQYGEDNEQLLQAIDEVKPDFIIVAGDMMIAKPGRTLDIAMTLLNRLADRYPVYYGMGNHEYRMKIYPQTYGDMWSRYQSFLQKKGVHLLENESVKLNIRGKRLMISGLEIDRFYYKRFRTIRMSGEYVEQELGRKTEDYTLLIAHNPDYFPAYASWGADLTFSGHVHGGIVRIPGVGGVVSPKIRLFPKYDAGLFRIGKNQMLVSRGLGMHTIPIRIFNRAEALVVELKIGSRISDERAD